jgi:hypothetical protein
MRTTVIRRTPIEVTDALAALGLTFEILRDAILAGETARDMCTANDPPSAAGFDAWARTVKRLREQLIVLGWSRSESDQLPLIISPSGTLAITVGTGDEGTGIWTPDSSPKSKYPKGPATIAVVSRNRNQSEFWESNEEEAAVPNPTFQTWVLLRSRVEDTVYSELSLPDAIGGDGRIEEWAERIILMPISLDPSGDVSVPNSPAGGGGGETIDVPVRRRGQK